MKKLLFLLLVFILNLLLAIFAFAHPGRTNSSGGHYNRSTGEYHYHHGYSAHDHYDMDGDGDKDCPYDFDDKTNHQSNRNSVTVSPAKTTVESSNISPPVKAEVAEAKKLSDGEILDVIFIIIFFPFFTLLAFGVYIYGLVGAIIEIVFKCEEATVKRASLIITFIIPVVISIVIAVMLYR